MEKLVEVIRDSLDSLRPSAQYHLQIIKVCEEENKLLKLLNEEQKEQYKIYDREHSELNNIYIDLVIKYVLSLYHE